MSQVDRINGGHTALMVKTEGENIYASINLDQFYEGYIAGEKTFEDVMGEISNQIQQEVPASLDTDFLSNYEKAKDVLFIRVCGAEQNKELLETVPHKTVEDLALTYHLLVSNGDELIGSAMVTNEHMEVYGVTPEQLHQDAIENSPKLFPMQILTIRDAYHYDREDHVFEMFSTYEARMAEMEKAAARSEQEQHPSSPAPKRESVLKRLDEKKSIVKAREEGRAKTAVKEKKKDQTLA